MLAKAQEYDQVFADLKSVMEGERDFLANMANCAALLFQTLSEVNWAGFYLTRGSDLVLGPFQGKVACTRIGPGRGVCGAAAQRRETVVVHNVHLFPGHIACDSASQSEVVVPLIRDGVVIGVLDIDSPSIGRFDSTDEIRLYDIVVALLKASDV